MSRPNKEGLSDTYKAKLCLGYICEFLREADSTGEGGPSVKEYRLVDFQYRIGAKIPPEDEEGLSQNPKSIRQRRWRKGLKDKKDYENLLREMKETAKKVK